MVDWYVNDDGDPLGDASDGLSWLRAYQSLADLETAQAPYAADTEIWIGHDHAEDTAGSVTFAFANGTELQPVRLLSVNTGTDQYQAGASITASSGGDIIITTGASVWDGITMVAADDWLVNSTNTVHKFYNCIIHPADSIRVSSAETTCKFFDCVLISDDAAVPQLVVVTECFCLVRGGSITQASAGSGEAIVSVSGDAAVCIIEDCDLSGSTSDMALASFLASGSNMQMSFRRCKLPSAFTTPAVPSGNNVLKVESCSSGTSTNPFLGIGGIDPATDADMKGWRTVIGDVRTSTTQKRTGGASDGVNSYSWEMAANANVSFFSPLVSPPISYWAEPGAQTVTIHSADDADLNDDELWMTVEHPDESVTNAEPVHTVLSNTKPNPLATPAAVTRDAGSTWDGAGTGTDGSTGQQKLVSSSFNPTVAGPVLIRVYLAKASATMYVDPKPVVA